MNAVDEQSGDGDKDNNKLEDKLGSVFSVKAFFTGNSCKVDIFNQKKYRVNK